MRIICRNCLNFEAFPEEDGQSDAHGWCRAKCPQAGSDGKAVWPIVNGGVDYCWEFLLGSGSPRPKSNKALDGLRKQFREHAELDLKERFGN